MVVHALYLVFELRNAGAIIHSHGMETCIVTMINPGAKEFRITNMEMIKAIPGYGYFEKLVVPIIDSTAFERELTDSLPAAIEGYPKSTAVLVRNHGIYVWGDTWAECYYYLYEAAIKLHQLGLDLSRPSHGPLNKVSNQSVVACAGTANVVKPKDAS